MKLKVLDQLHVSSVQPDSLRPGQEIEVSDALGNELLHKHAAKFERLDKPARKRAATPKNKAIVAAPANKGTDQGNGSGE